MRKRVSILIVLFLVVPRFVNLNAQEQKKVLTLDDYPRWSRINSTGLSVNGQWITYAYQPNEGDDTLYIKNLKTHEVINEPYCSNPEFSENAEWVAFYHNLKEKEVKKLKKSKKPVTRKAVLMNLKNHSKTEWDKVSGFQFSPGSDFFIVKKKENHKGFSGTDLLVHSLKDNWTMNLGNVSAYKFNSQGTLMAYLIDAADKAGNGLYLLELAGRVITPLDTDTLKYSKLTWDDEMLFRSERETKGTALAVLKGYKPDTLTQRINKLVVVTALNGRPQKRIFNAEDLAGFPGGDVISESGSIRFSLDNQRIALSIKEQSKVIKASKDTIANVDVWHWNDEEIQSVQMVRISREKRKTYTGILHLNDSRFVQLSSDNLRYVSLNRNLNRAVGADPKPYINDINWGGGFSDYYLVNTQTGKKTLMEKKIGRSMGLSPDGSYFLFFKDKNFHLYDLDTRKMTNLTAGMEVSFFNQEEDHPYENPSYGLAGWTDDRQSVILNHKYDLWIVSVDGSGGYNLTGKYGSAKEIRFRLIRLTDEPYIHLEKDIYLSAYGEWTKKSGYFLLRKGKEPKQLVFADASFGRLRKAREAGRFLFTRQTFVDFPDYYTSDLKFKKIVRQTDANPQQVEYKWGRRILIDFKNSRGDKLAATLTLPADYQPGKKYPMLVYFYEKMSQRHHNYSMPTYDDRPHMSTYASDGYLVLMPDIKYYVGQPGWCAVDCITSAVKKVIDLGYADPARIGLQGHSWGGYQSSFILTQTDMFACVVTGAPVTNLTSMYDILYKNSGTNNHGIFERGQVRMGKGMFEDMDNYIAQSPVQQASHITTPFMILQGTKDGAVDWNQGLELYNAARRLGKKVILLSYPGENHHLANRNNQKDFQLRMKQFFDHYLKGTTAPDWMVKGVKFVDKPYENAK